MLLLHVLVAGVHLLLETVQIHSAVKLVKSGIHIITHLSAVIVGMPHAKCAIIPCMDVLWIVQT